MCVVEGADQIPNVILRLGGGLARGDQVLEGAMAIEFRACAPLHLDKLLMFYFELANLIGERVVAQRAGADPQFPNLPLEAGTERRHPLQRQAEAVAERVSGRLQPNPKKATQQHGLETSRAIRVR